MNTFLPNIYEQPENEMKERLLAAVSNHPQAFKILPLGKQPEERGSWASYEFDGTVNLWVNTAHQEAIEMYKGVFMEKKEQYMAKELTVQEQGTVKQLLSNNIKAIKSVLPKHLTPERMLRVAYTTIVQNPKLARCNQLSLINGVIGASVIGLEIGGPLGLAHLIPFGKEATLIIDYKGLIELMYKSSLVKNVSAHPVYDRDEFKYSYGTNPFIDHVPFDGPGERGKLIYAYCVVFFTNGGFEFEVVNQKDADAAKEHSRAKSSSDSPWNKDADVWTMWVKTAVRKISKRIPKSPELQRALNIDTAADEGKDVKEVIEADFEVVADDPAPEANGEKKTDPKPEVPKSEPTKPKNEEESKIIKGYELVKEGFLEEHDEAIRRLKLEGVILSIEDMGKITIEVGQIVDQQQAA